MASRLVRGSADGRKVIAVSERSLEVESGEDELIELVLGVCERHVVLYN